MKPFDDPFAALEAEADRLVEALAAMSVPAPEEVLAAANALRRAIGRTSGALQRRRGSDLRAALAEIEQKKDIEELALEKVHAGERIGRLEREVEALLLPSRDDARKLYQARTAELARDLDAARRHREDVEARLGATSSASEMERSRDALLVAAAHIKEGDLAAELASVEKKLARLVL